MKVGSSISAPPQQLAFDRARQAWSRDADALGATTKDLWRAGSALRNNDRLIFLVGDSIFRGVNGGDFAFDAKDERYILLHIDRIINVLAAAVDTPVRAAFSGILAPSQLHKAIESAIRPGDVVLYQDWGWRPRTAKASYHSAASVASLVKEFPGVDLAFMNCYSTSASAALDWAATCDDSDKSPNDILKGVADEFQADFIDIEAQCEAADRWCQTELGVSIMQADRVHPSALGNCLIACSIAKRLGGCSPSSEPLADLLVRSGFSRANVDSFFYQVRRILS